MSEDQAPPAAIGSDELDRLYRCELADFTERRNGLAKRLLAGGEREAAEWVRKRPKPVVTAWVINQLYFEHGDDFDELLLAGEEVRRAQQSGQGHQAADERRRRAIARLLDAAEALLVASDRGSGAGARQRIARTLEAVAAYGEAAPQAPGRMHRDLEPPGFEVLLGLALSGSGRDKSAVARVSARAVKKGRGRKRSTPTPAAQTKSGAAAARARKQELDRTKREVAKRQDRLTAASAEAKTAQKARLAGERRQATAERGLQRAEESLAKAREKLESAKRDTAAAVKLHRQRELQRLTAEKELEAAQRALQRLEREKG